MLLALYQIYWFAFFRNKSSNFEQALEKQNIVKLLLITWFCSDFSMKLKMIEKLAILKWRK